MQQNGKYFVIDTTRHNMTARQSLEQMLWAFHQHQDAVVWLVVHEPDAKLTRQRLQVALSKMRYELSVTTSSLDAAITRQFRLACEEEYAPLNNGCVALRFTYNQSRRHKLNIAMLQTVRKVVHDLG